MNQTKLLWTLCITNIFFLFFHQYQYWNHMYIVDSFNLKRNNNRIGVDKMAHAFAAADTTKLPQSNTAAASSFDPFLVKYPHYGPDIAWTEVKSVEAWRNRNDEVYWISEALWALQPRIIVVPTEIAEGVKALLAPQRGQNRGYDYSNGGNTLEFARYLYYDNMRSFEALKPALRASDRVILDIGSGLGIYNIFVYRYFLSHFRHPVKLIYADQTREQTPSRFGFKADAYEFYSSLQWARDIGIANGISPLDFHTLNVSNENIRSLGEHSVDQVQSFVSWGFHYPVALYLDSVYKILRPGGQLLIEIRTNTLKEQMKILLLKSWANGDGECETLYGSASITALLCLKP